MFKKIFPQLDSINVSMSLWETMDVEATAKKIVKAMIAFIFITFFDEFVFQKF